MKLRIGIVLILIGLAWCVGAYRRAPIADRCFSAMIGWAKQCKPDLPGGIEHIVIKDNVFIPTESETGYQIAPHTWMSERALIGLPEIARRNPKKPLTIKEQIAIFDHFGIKVRVVNQAERARKK